MRRSAGAVVVLVLSAGFYLLLIDTTSAPELYVLLAVALLATGAYSLSREPDFPGPAISVRWLRQAWRPLARVPLHIVLVSREAIAQLLHPRRSRGEFRAVPFRGGEDAEDHGRSALAEVFGSIAPNTIVIGVDPDRDLLLVHQLRRGGGREELDVLGLG